MQSYFLRSVGRVLASISLSLMPVALAAQAAPAARGVTNNDSPSRWDIFVGYSYLAPKGTVQVLQSNGSTAPFSYDAVNVGGLASGTYYFNQFVGFQAEYGVHEWGGQAQPARTSAPKGTTMASRLVGRRPDSALPRRQHYSVRARVGWGGIGGRAGSRARQVGA